MRSWDYGDKSKVGRRLHLVSVHQDGKLNRISKALKDMGGLQPGTEILVYRENAAGLLEHLAVGVAWHDDKGRLNLGWISEAGRLTRTMMAEAGHPEDAPRWVDTPDLRAELARL